MGLRLANNEGIGEKGAELIAYTKEEILSYISKLMPLTLVSIERYSKLPGLYEPPYNYMTSHEKKVALLLLSKGLVIYREIPIGKNGSTADFYVYNPRSKSGKLVEVTLMKKSYRPKEKKPSYKTKKRKENQLDLLKATGMPFVVLYREEFESIDRFLSTNLV